MTLAEAEALTFQKGDRGHCPGSCGKAHSLWIAIAGRRWMCQVCKQVVYDDDMRVWDANEAAAERAMQGRRGRQDRAAKGARVSDPKTGEITVIEPLTAQEKEELGDHENTIALGAQVFIAVGDALLDIQARKLYRASYRSFEDYLERRWPKLKLRRAYQYINAAQTMNNLYTVGSDWTPANEGQARELAGLEERDLLVIASVIHEIKAGGDTTAAEIKSFVNVLREITATGAVDDGTGEQIPVGQATVQHLKAAVLEETYERSRRQAGYIREGSAWQRVNTLVVTTDTGLQDALEAITTAFYDRAKVKVSYYIEKEEQPS